MADATLEPGFLVAGRYRIDSQLGSGAMGAVYLARHVHTEEKLALKVLLAAVAKDALALERFRREARAPARIESEYVVRVVDADQAPELGGSPFLVMEYLKGRTLEAEALAVGRIPKADVLTYLRQVARALDKAHAIGIVHRDLKPENIFLTHREDGTPCVKLLDFGIAKFIAGDGESPPTALQTQTGVLFGTPMYMSPEQARGEAPLIGPWTDTWSLGLIAHRLLTGRVFWKAATMSALVGEVLYEPIPRASDRGSDLGPAFDAWFARSCDREREHRFQKASECVAALADALGAPDSSLLASAPVRGVVASEREASAGDPGGRDVDDEPTQVVASSALAQPGSVPAPPMMPVGAPSEPVPFGHSTANALSASTGAAARHAAARSQVAPIVVAVFALATLVGVMAIVVSRISGSGKSSADASTAAALTTAASATMAEPPTSESAAATTEPVEPASAAPTASASSHAKAPAAKAPPPRGPTKPSAPKKADPWDKR